LHLEIIIRLERLQEFAPEWLAFAVTQLTPFQLPLWGKSAEAGILRISMQFNRAVAAVIIGFELNGKLYGYLTGSDPAYKQFSAGSILLANAIRRCCEQKVRTWNFCRGDEAYKAGWGAKAIPRCRVVIERKRSS
jgi:CelD/BcsL family acetyltransferase involved in cellulose biosynthesis